MKEVTEWNGKPRKMLVWDKDEEHANVDFVIYILSADEMRECGMTFPVRGVFDCYLHCAEIEEEAATATATATATHLTNYELSQLLKCMGVESLVGCIIPDNFLVQNSFNYEQGKDSEAILNTFIRYKCGEWMPATRETVMKWCEENKANMLDEVQYFARFMGWDKEINK